MAEEFTSYSVDNDRTFRRAIKAASEKISDLTIPLTLISQDWYRSERAIFKLKGPGQYPDLSPGYKAFKASKVGFVYPILKRTGRLAQSLTDPTSSKAINQIINKDTLIIGTKVKYGVFHQSDRPRRKIPLRKFLFIGPESGFAMSPQKGRLQRWLGILSGFVDESTSDVGEYKK
jgi:phage gpG-like protein